MTPGGMPQTVCVVSDYKDMTAIESMGAYKGTYHILHGNLAPLKGVGPDELRLKELLKRVDAGGIKEVILATGFDSEGEATSAYISKLLKSFGRQGYKARLRHTGRELCRVHGRRDPRARARRKKGSIGRYKGRLWVQIARVAQTSGSREVYSLVTPQRRALRSL